MLTLPQMVEAVTPRVSGPYRPQVGFELELAFFHRSTLRPLGIDGDVGLRRVMERAAELTGAKPWAKDPDKKLALPDGAFLSLEPGGQFEFSSPPVSSASQLQAQLDRFLGLVETLSAELELHPFFGGANPVHTLDEIGLVVATERYRRMNDYYPTVGAMGRRMMRQSCSLQVTFDAPDAEGARDLMVAGLHLAPVLAGITSHTPYIDNRFSGFLSYRVPIWQDTDPHRSGPVPGFWEPEFGLEDYVRYIVQAPLFFVRQDGKLVDPEGLTFAQYNTSGFRGQYPTLEEFLEHNTTIFTDCRLKRTVEFRPVDGQDPALVVPTVLWLCGLLMSEEGRRATRELLAPLVGENYREVQLAWGKEGPAAGIGPASGWALAEQLLDIAAAHLPQALPDGRQAVDTLETWRPLVRARRTPAEVVLERFPTAREWLQAGRTFADGVVAP